MPKIVSKKTGKEITVSSAEAQQLVDAGLYSYPEGERIVVEGPAGPQSVEPAFAGGSDVLAPGAEQGARAERTTEETYGDENFATAAQGVLSGLTGGFSDVAQRIQPLAHETAARRAEANPIARTGGEIAGALAGAAATGGGIGSAVTEGRLGAALAERGLAGRVAAGALGGATEGAVQGAGQGVRELALSDDPLTAENIASTLSSNALYGAALGGVVGGAVPLVGTAADKSLARAKRYLDDVVAKQEAVPAVAENLADLDRAGLRAAKEAEEARLADEVVVTKKQIADDLYGYRERFDEANPWLAIENKETRKRLVKARNALRGKMDERISLGERPEMVLRDLRVEAQALRDALGEGDEVLAKVAASDEKLASDVAKKLKAIEDDAEINGLVLQGKARDKASDFLGRKIKAKTEIPREDVQAFVDALRSGDIASQRKASLESINGLIAENEQMQARILATKEKPLSPRLGEIEAANDALSSGNKGGGILGSAKDRAATAIGFAAGNMVGMPFLGGAVGSALSGLSLRGVRTAMAEQAGKVAKALDRVTAAIKVGERKAPPGAIRTLTKLSYGDGGGEAIPKATVAKMPRGKLVSAYKQRESEIRNQTTVTADGTTVMRPEARREMSKKLAPLRVMNPLLADKVETAAARRVEFLAAKLPKRPDLVSLRVGPDTWRPSDFEISKFARYANAAENPAAVLERVADGTVTPSDAEALRSVYPEMYQSMRAQIIENLGALQKTLPYEKRLALSILFDAPVDPSMSPMMIRRLQSSFQAEPGTQGGTMPPNAEPISGSISTPEPTPAQKRAEG